MKKILSITQKICFIVGLIYIVAITYLLINQRSFIYSPRARDERNPGQFAVPYKEVQIPVNRDQVLSAWWIEQGNNTENINLVYCHGNGASLSSLAHVSKIFYSYGWNALLYDYRGYGNSSKNPAGLSEESLAEDARVAYDWLEAKPQKAGRIFIWGHSLGSAVAARLAYERQSARALVLEGAFPSTWRMARYRYPWAWLPRSFILDNFASEEYVSNSYMPKLFIHAEHDRIVPPPFGEELYNRANGKKHWILVKDVGHNDFPDVEHRYREEIMGVVRDVFK
jgi:uncharacterized protein